MMTIKEPLPFQVNLWGSHPRENNDDCNNGYDFATKEEALARFEFEQANNTYCPFVEVLGDDLYRVARTKCLISTDGSNWKQEWQREMAIEAGMLHGIDAYNEMMGC